MRRILFVLVPLALLGVLIGWRLKGKAAEVAAQQKTRTARLKAAPMVSAVPAEARDIVETFETTGSVEAPFNVRLSSKITGRIDYLQAREGDRVKLGQVLVRLDPVEVDALVAREKASLAEAEARLAQASINTEPLDASVQTEIRRQQAAVASARADLTQVVENSESKKAAVWSAVTDAEGRIKNAEAATGNAQATIQSASASLENARAKLERVLSLYKQGFIAAQDVDDAKNTVATNQAALETARQELAAAEAQRKAMVAQREYYARQYDIGKNGVITSQAVADAKLKQAQAALETAKANTAQQPAYRQNLAALNAAVAAARASVLSAESHRADTIITAPMEGVVAARFMDPGAMAVPGVPILGLLAARRVWVTLSAPEEVSRKIQMGRQAEVTFDESGGKTVKARVIQVNPSADPQNRQFQVRLDLDNRRNLFKPGMVARVRMEIARTPHATVVPREAVQRSKNESAVFVLDAGGTAVRRRVVTGASDAIGTSVVTGLQPGERVVTLSAVPLRDGMKTIVMGKDWPNPGAKPELHP